jgi:transcriptional regulator GlxA family with amidase domain
MRVVVIVVPPVDELDLVGPLKVFGAANRLSKRHIYDVEILTSKDVLLVRGEEGLLTFSASGHFRDAKGKFDSLLLVCGLKTRNERDPELLAWLRKIAPAVRRMGSVCVGSFLFAEAGLLKGRRATAHWKYGRELAKRHPEVKVESDPIWVKDGNIYTCAGISAGLDLALAWVEEDCGAPMAQEIAREFVMFLRRSGKQNQVSVSLSSQAAEMKAIQELQLWIAENFHRDLSMQMLADRVAMSVRNLERVFVREIGKSPFEYLMQVRVEAAKHQLERTDRGLKQIAAACGFQSADRMRRSFQRALGITPNQYRLKLQPNFAEQTRFERSKFRLM